jgi:hypothetical protein
MLFGSRHQLGASLVVFMNVGIGLIEQLARDRESNPPKQAKPKHKTGRPYTKKRP